MTARPAMQAICMSGLFSDENAGAGPLPPGVPRLQKPVDLVTLANTLRTSLTPGETD
jgi:hypothetical protein